MSQEDSRLVDQLELMQIAKTVRLGLSEIVEMMRKRLTILTRSEHHREDDKESGGNKPMEPKNGVLDVHRAPLEQRGLDL